MGQKWSAHLLLSLLTLFCLSSRRDLPLYFFLPSRKSSSPRKAERTSVFFLNIENIVISTEAAHAFVSSVEKSASLPRHLPNQRRAFALLLFALLLVIPQASAVAFAFALALFLLYREGSPERALHRFSSKLCCESPTAQSTISTRRIWPSPGGAAPKLEM